jgi:hypothetical protein
MAFRSNSTLRGEEAIQGEIPTRDTMTIVTFDDTRPRLLGEEVDRREVRFVAKVKRGGILMRRTTAIFTRLQ